MNEILIGFLQGQAEGMRDRALTEDNQEKRRLMLTIADTCLLLHDQLIELGKMQAATSPNPNDESAAH